MITREELAQHMAEYMTLDNPEYGGSAVDWIWDWLWEQGTLHPPIGSMKAFVSVLMEKP